MVRVNFKNSRVWKKFPGFLSHFEICLTRHHWLQFRREPNMWHTFITLLLCYEFQNHLTDITEDIGQTIHLDASQTQSENSQFQIFVDNIYFGERASHYKMSSYQCKDVTCYIYTANPHTWWDGLYTETGTRLCFPWWDIPFTWSLKDNIRIDLHFLSFIDIELMQAVEIMWIMNRINTGC